jgi:predicted membrane protein (TIGR00267 family)
MKSVVAVHHEPHKGNFKLAELILGGQDGLVNVLGVILGVAAASQNKDIVIAGGLAATFAESISMAAVAYTSIVAEVDHYAAELKREQREVKEMPDEEREEIRQIYRQKGFEGELLEQVVAKITSDENTWIDIMMKEELGLEPKTKRGAFITGLVVGLSALVGSFVPLIPFFLLSIKQAIPVSLVVSGLALFAVGAYKAKNTIGRPLRSGTEMVVIGIVSALAGYAIGALFHANGIG